VRAWIASAIAPLPVPERTKTAREIAAHGLDSLTIDHAARILAEPPLERQMLVAWLLGRAPRRRSVVDALLAVWREGESRALTEQVGTALAHVRGLRVRRAARQMLADRQSGEALRAQAAYVLGWEGTGRDLRPLCEVAEDAETETCVRACALEAIGHLALGRCGLPATVERRVRGLLSHPEAEIRFWAAFALGNGGGPASLPALRAAAAQDDVELAGWGSVRGEVVEAIARIQARSAGAA
jgi:hypothetical protein